jgi:hypothetical protein
VRLLHHLGPGSRVSAASVASAHGRPCGDRDPRTFNRRYLEVATILELAESINGRAIHVDGSLSYDDFWGRLPSEANDPAKMAAYASERGWDTGAKGFTNRSRQSDFQIQSIGLAL